VLVERLAPGFKGPAWVRFAEELARYGLAVMGAWLASGEIFEQCRRKGCPCGPPPAGWSRQDRDDLASDTVGEAIRVFRQRALIEEQWDPDGGASLASYFIGSCIHAFPNTLRRWKSRQQRAAVEEPVEPAAATFIQLPGPIDVEAHVLNRIAFAEGVAAIHDTRTRTAVVLQAQGYTLAEIAELLSAGEDTVVTVRAVEGLLRRHRRRVSAEGRTR
jgi:DNA-directed RNA polymerase specialized sigma24 family protein